LDTGGTTSSTCGVRLLWSTYKAVAARVTLSPSIATPPARAPLRHNQRHTHTHTHQDSDV
jgi:hypothetical protein